MADPLRTPRPPPSDVDCLSGLSEEGQVISALDLHPSALAYLALALWHENGVPLVIVTDGPASQDLLVHDLITLSGEHQFDIVAFPAREALPGRSTLPNPDLVGERIRTLQRCLVEPFPAVLATSIQALLQPTRTPHELQVMTRDLKVGDDADPDQLAEKLAEEGYEFHAEVQSKGQASRRGGLLDLWPPTEGWPVRLEFFGTVLDSIRTFDPVEQRSVEKLQRVSLGPPGEIDDSGRGTSTLLDFLPHQVHWLWSNTDAIKHHAERYREAVLDPSRSARLPSYASLRKRIAKGFTGGHLQLGADDGRPEGIYEFDLKACEALAREETTALYPDQLQALRDRYLEEAVAKARAGWKTHIFLSTEGARERLAEQLQKIDPDGLLELRTAALSSGFSSASHRLLVLAESDIYGRQVDTRGRLRAEGKRHVATRMAGQRLAEWSDVQPGDLVVHANHGVGKYLGLYEITFDQEVQEVLSIEYAEGARLYVPVSQAHLLSRYIGLGKKSPRLHTLGGRKWQRDRTAADEAVRDLAASLLSIHASRQVRGGHIFSEDTPWQHEFEAAFPYEETDDQVRALQEVKEDMEREQPMERLICGDVGYGKTEVAMRAAFKCIMDKKQVAMLVPTTILAQQHYDTFLSRMQAFPITLASLSRFQTKMEQREVIQRLKRGEVDIVIGTHRLIQHDVHYKDLGLLIIDEEQRFGVDQKEHIKRVRQSVDVLTLTATPIPRTLYMSLTGARDMSTIQTPPQERLPIETLVAEDRDEVIREAVLRELNRDGQVFFLHNRVKTIDRVQQRVERLVPEARVCVAHGQMPERELEEVMHRFIRKEFDVLVCTTIIESGVDIPNVNTIIIDRADRFGMSGLYQLRGRVGRFKHQAYAYLLIPKHGQIYDTARKRIGAIKKYSSLGAGFKLALQDLEIRGAGNLLGAQQSGHISAVGFDMYCQLLKRSVASLKGEPVPPIVDVDLKLDFIDLAPGHADEENAAVIPTSYMEDEHLRVNAYRKVAALSYEKEVDELRDEFEDRFGPLPPALQRLLKLVRLRLRCAAKDVQSIEVRDNKVMMMRNGDYVMYDKLHPRLTKTAPSARLDEMLAMVKKIPDTG